jgi:transposase
MAKIGRKNKYYSHVEPHLKHIPDMLQTMTEEQVAKKLGVGYSNWMKYKREFKELQEVIKKGNTSLVGELKSVLKRRAKGFQYEERKIIKEHGVVVREETYVKSALPDVASINLLLKNYDKDNWSNDPQILEVRKKELELREKQIKANSWMLEE